MTHRLLFLLAVIMLPACAARNLDDLSSSHERLVAAHRERSRPDARPAPSGSPPHESLGASFLAVGNAAREAAGSGATDPSIRIALYRVAAASAHFVLVEEASTGRRVAVVATAQKPTTPTAVEAGASGVVIMRRATSEGSALCEANRYPLPRDCSYLAVAESMALLAVLAEPWIRRNSVGSAPSAEVASLAGALQQAPDADFDAALDAYRRGSDRARSGLAQAGLALGSGAEGTSDPAGFVRANDVRAYCIAVSRNTLVQSVADRGTAIPGITREGAGAAETTSRNWLTERHGDAPISCAPL
jgi:hypothetical protein